MKEIINLNIGDAGIRIGDQILTQYVKQHQLIHNNHDQPTHNNQLDNYVIFNQLENGNHTFRSIGIDCDPYSQDGLLTGKNRQFYSHNNLLNCMNDTGGLYSRGHYLCRTELKQQIQDTIRKTVQNCSQVEGIMFNNSVTGGGSGIFSFVSQMVATQYPKVPKIGNIIFPSQKYCSNVVEPYNFVLSANSQLNHLDIVIPFDNQTLYQKCQENLGIERPGFTEINKINAQFQSTLTLSMRQRGSLNTNFRDLLTNIICYPRIHFTYPSFVGFEGDSRSLQINNSEKLTKTVLEPHSRLFNIGGVRNKIAISMFYRGDVNPLQVQLQIAKMKQDQHHNCIFEEWSPLGFKVAVNEFPLHEIQYQNRTHSRFAYPSCCSLTSSMQFYQYLAMVNQKFDRLYSKRAFVYWYVQDMEEGQFTEGREDLAALQKDYEPLHHICCLEDEQEYDDLIE